MIIVCSTYYKKMNSFLPFRINTTYWKPWFHVSKTIPQTYWLYIDFTVWVQVWAQHCRKFRWVEKAQCNEFTVRIRDHKEYMLALTYHHQWSQAWTCMHSLGSGWRSLALQDSANTNPNFQMNLFLFAGTLPRRPFYDKL